MTSCVPAPSGNGRGLAFDPIDGNLWYTFVVGSGFAGDGLIHKTTPPAACAPAGVIPFGDGPGGVIQDDVGALDVDSDDGNLWAAGYHPIGGNSFLYKVNRSTGAILASCFVPFGGGGEGNDTLTEAKLSGLSGSGSYLLTDAGEPVTSPNDVLVVDEASCVGGGAGTIVASFAKAVAMTGIDYELSSLFATDLNDIFSLGGPPFAPVLAAMSASPSSTLEDITLKVGPGAPARLILTPKTATNTVGTQHCVTATVTDQFGNPTPGVTVRFSVSGPNGPLSGSAVTDANGQAQFCYTGTVTGTDTISAFADTNNNGVQNANEPSDTAAKTWTAGPPATLTLEPATDTNTVGDTHCVTATVRDSFGNPVPGVTVNFTVSGANTNGGVDVTDANGQAEFCYVGTVAGNDLIRATAVGGSDPSDTATKTWEPGDPATLDLTPATATNTVDAQHCVTATVKDQFGNPTPGITVRFSVAGPGATSGSATTNAAGQATFCYSSALPGSDVITAYADTDNDNVNDATEPEDTATKTWVLPASTEGCKVTYGGRITAANGDKATFGGNAQANGPKGNENYQDHGPAVNMHVKSIDVLSVVCSRDGTQASIFGTASIDGSGSFNFRVDLKDLGEPGTSDTYRIRLSNGYDSGEQVLAGGNVQIH